jgi:alpha-ketoglutarate-dependent taurine dioxygenase
MPRKVIQPIFIESFDSLVDNLSEYINLFKKQAIIVFRGFKFSREQQLTVTRFFGDSMAWYPNSITPVEQYSSYEENHSKTMQEYNKYNIGKDELFLPWHLEHMGHKNPAIGATWNMEKFTCDYGTGNTLFCNISDVYDLFNEEDALFLKKCRVAAFYGWSAFEKENQIKPTFHDAVQFYEPSGRMALRLNALFKYDRETFYLHEFDGREPSEEENSKFLDLSLTFTRNIQNNEEVQQVHMWQENDLAVVDLFLMAHAVLGGFKPSERFFHGYWAHRKRGSKYD